MALTLLAAGAFAAQSNTYDMSAFKKEESELTKMTASLNRVGYDSRDKELGACQCLGCVDLAPVLTAAACPGPSMGCSARSAAGCFGQAQDGTGGTCMCQTALMTDPEIYVLGGTVHGLAPGARMEIAAQSTGGCAG